MDGVAAIIDGAYASPRFNCEDIFPTMASVKCLTSQPGDEGYIDPYTAEISDHIVPRSVVPLLSGSSGSRSILMRKSRNRICVEKILQRRMLKKSG
jgi:hypothetical protein